MVSVGSSAWLFPACPPWQEPTVKSLPRKQGCQSSRLISWGRRPGRGPEGTSPSLLPFPWANFGWARGRRAHVTKQRTGPVANGARVDSPSPGQFPPRPRCPLPPPCSPAPPSLSLPLSPTWASPPGPWGGCRPPLPHSQCPSDCHFLLLPSLCQVAWASPSMGRLSCQGDPSAHLQRPGPRLRAGQSSREGPSPALGTGQGSAWCTHTAGVRRQHALHSLLKINI